MIFEIIIIWKVKRKAAHEELESSKKKRKRDLEKVCEKLEERDVLADKAETKTGATALTLITQSNPVARTVKEKR